MYQQNLGPIYRLQSPSARVFPYTTNDVGTSRFFTVPHPSTAHCSFNSTNPEINASTMKFYPDQSSSISAHSSPSSGPGTPNQNDFNLEFGVPHQLGQPSSVSSVTDALCPNGEISPISPISTISRITQTGYSVPQNRLNHEQNIDELTAFLQDPMHFYLSDDLTATLHEDIDILADTYLGGRGDTASSNINNTIEYNVILNFLYSDDLMSSILCED